MERKAKGETVLTEEQAKAMLEAAKKSSEAVNAAWEAA